MAYSLMDVKNCALFLKSKGIDSPAAGIVLGTGLGALVNKIEIKISIPYNEIPNFPEATVEFHKGALIYGNINNVAVLVMQGRFHYYERSEERRVGKECA